MNTETQVVVLPHKEEKINLSKILLWVAFALIACEANNSVSAQVATDYSQAKHWLSLPATCEAVDIFYLYPTAWSNSDPNPVICRIDDPSMLIMAPLAFERQATAFETVGNVYAPFYRQDNNSSIRRLEVIADIPTLDAVTAFHYYIKHFNNNRPFILAGHSQGATVLSNLLAEYMKYHPDVYSRMVAAYVIGHPITTGYIDANPHLKFAEGPDDTGVIVSYNTEASWVDGTNPVLYGMVGLVINPLTWTKDETPVSNDYNLGSILLNSDGSVARDPNGEFKRMVPSANARVDNTKGVLICSNVDVDVYSPGPPSSPYPKGVFHTFDYPFYYYNIRANAANRVKNYLSNPTRRWIYDYNGDGTSDIAIFRGSSGLWAMRGLTRAYFGNSSDSQVPGDYNGNGTTDIGIFRASTGLWAIRGLTRVYFGSSSDIPVPGDYNGDDTCDQGIFRGGSGLWAIRNVTRVYCGISGDTTVPGYYDASGRESIGIFRGSSGLWAIRGLTTIYFGSSTDSLVPGDYDGNGRWEAGVFRPVSGLWAVKGVTRVYFGSSNDRPVPANYQGDRRDDIGIFRGTSGLWAIRGISRVYFGSTGDVPVTR